MPEKLKTVAAFATPTMAAKMLWDGKDRFVQKARFFEMGHEMEMEQPCEIAICLLLEWGAQSRLDDNFNITEADAEALDIIMEGQEEWHPLQVQ